MALRDLLATFKVEVDGKALLDVDKRLNDVKDTAGSTGEAFHNLALIGAAAGAALVAGLGAALTDLVGQAADLNDTATALGTTTQAVQQLGYAAKLSGLDQGELEAALFRLNRSMGQAAQGGGELAKSFKALKIDPKNFTDPADLFEAVGIAIGEIEDPFKQSGIAAEFFGKSAGKLIPLFKEGQEGLDQLKGEAEDFGAVFSQAFVADASEIDDNLDRLKFQFKGLTTEIVSFFLPYFREATELLIDFGKTALDIVRSDSFARSLKAIALVITGALLPAIYAWTAALWAQAPAALAAFAPYAGAAALLLGIALIVEDLITFLEGGDSATGRLLDTMFGAGSAAQVLEGLKAVWWAIGQAVAAALPYLQEVWDWITARLPEAWAVYKELAEGYLRSVGDALKFFGNLLGEIAYLIVNVFAGSWNEVEASAKRVFANISQGLAALWTRVSAFGEGLAKLAGGDFSGALAAAKVAITGTPTAPPGTTGPAGIALQDGRTTEINLYGVQNPAEAGRAVAGAVAAAQVSDRQATFEAIGAVGF